MGTTARLPRPALLGDPALLLCADDRRLPPSSPLQQLLPLCALICPISSSPSCCGWAWLPLLLQRCRSHAAWAWPFAAWVWPLQPPLPLGGRVGEQDLLLVLSSVLPAWSKRRVALPASRPRPPSLPSCFCGCVCTRE
jgi:hypothetical protein